MAEIIRMPKMSDTMTEGVIANWLKKVGDEVQSGDILAEVETDKATMELESYEDGTLLYIAVENKGTVPVDGILAIIGEKGEDINAILQEVQTDENTAEAEKSAPEASAEETPQPDDTSGIDATVVRMPKMSDTMTEGTITAWHKQVGDDVASGDILAEVETDKATMELESYEDGKLLYIGVEAGNSISVDSIIAIIGAENADYQTLLKSETKKSVPPASQQTSAPAVASAASAAVPEVQKPEASAGRIFASPLAKRIAKEKGYDLSLIQGTGENGRIIKRDIESYVPAQAPATVSTEAEASREIQQLISLPPSVGEESYQEVPVSQMRKAIARRLSESKQSSPHFYVTMEIDMDKAVEARKSLNELSPVKISFNDLVVKACASALRKHPDINSSWQGDTIRMNNHISIGVAIAVPDGLVVPVVRFADTKSLSHISGEIKNFGTRAKNKKITPDEMTGNTFTISNLGMYGVEKFTAIIYPPDACILAVGGIHQKPVVKNGQIVPGNVMKVTLSSDHRAVDGAKAADFLNTLKNLLEDPIRLLV
ncbi:MAG: pyruvate dehydrogenase complex dihydrolipoamide acetyltransferase [Cytophagales bacterium]|nr:pyruvate dehydrogenase complex dihydrolipoamide acetyltransferase [Cytophagales bacterium]